MSQKNKNIILVLGFLIVVFLAYRFSFKKTFELKREYGTLEVATMAQDNMPLKLSTLKKKQKYYDSLLLKYRLKEGSLQNNILSTINTFAAKNNLKLVDFIEPHRLVQGDVTVSTYRFTLEGSYPSIIDLVHQLEQKTKFGEIISLSFKKEKNHRTGKYFLQANVLLKSFG